MRPLLAIALLLTGCRAPRALDADQRSVVEHARDLEAAGEALAILTGARQMHYNFPATAE